MKAGRCSFCFARLQVPRQRKRLGLSRMTHGRAHSAEGSQYNPSHVVTVDLGSYTDTLPAGILVQSVVATWGFGNDTLSGTPVPTVTLYLNGTQLGPTQTISQSNVNCLSPGTYQFDSGVYSTGVPGYVVGGSNKLTMVLTDGGIYFSNGPAMTVTYVIPPRIEFSVTAAALEFERRIIISNGHSYPYPHNQFRDGEMFLFLRARDQTLNYASGLTVYVRVIDPPDSAAYANLTSNPIAHTSDNDGRGTTITGLTAVPGTLNVYQGVSGSNGFLGFTLHLNSPASGDNFQIDPAFGASWTSGILTAWKRMFVEKREMLRNGMNITQIAPLGRIASRSRRTATAATRAAAASGKAIASSWCMHRRSIVRTDSMAGTPRSTTFST